MAEQKLPYMNAYGVIGKTLVKIKSAALPDRFTQDFLSTKLAIKGGSAMPVIPFLKRVGFLGTDGIPTDIYKKFRNPAQSGKAASQALKIGYAGLYEMNEYVHELSDKEVTGLIVQSTGLETGSRIVKSVLGSFKALKEFASFEDDDSGEGEDISDEKERDTEERGAKNKLPQRLGISYTINLQLPATSDITVFDAIFKSLKEHILKD